MPPVRTKTPSKSSRPRRSKHATKKRRPIRDDQPTYVVQNDRPTHVIIPIEEYERMIEAVEAQELKQQLNDQKTEWVSAEDAALEIAGTWIARARKKAGLTQKQLATRLRVPQSQISRIEKNPERSTIRTMKRIARALRIDLATLLSFATED